MDAPAHPSATDGRVSGLVQMVTLSNCRFICKGDCETLQNKDGYMATLAASGWAGAVLEEVTRASGQEPYAQKAQKRRKSKGRKSVRWSAVPVPCLSWLWLRLRGEQGT